jgi:hypothetical protein
MFIAGRMSHRPRVGAAVRRAGRVVERRIVAPTLAAAMPERQTAYHAGMNSTIFPAIRPGHG